MGGGGSAPSVPNINTRSIGDIYSSATNASIENLPKLIDAYAQYGPQYMQAQRSVMQQGNPEQWGVYSQTASNLQNSLNFIGQAGTTGVPDPLRQQFETNLRSSQAARGNAEGPASATTEAANLGVLGESYRQNVTNEANDFLKTSTGVSPTASLSTLGLTPTDPGTLAQTDANSLEPLRYNNAWDTYNAQLDQYAMKQKQSAQNWQTAGQIAGAAATGLMFL